MFVNMLFEREPAVMPISRDHGVLLVLVQRLRKAAAGQSQDRIFLAGEIKQKFAGVVQQYLTDESKALSTVKFSKAIQDEIARQHAAIIRAVRNLGKSAKSKLTAESFITLADLIEKHVRWDERTVLPYLQEVISAGDLEKLIKQTSTIESEHMRPIKMLHHSINLDKQSGQAQTCTCADSVKTQK